MEAVKNIQPQHLPEGIHMVRSTNKTSSSSATPQTTDDSPLVVLFRNLQQHTIDPAQPSITIFNMKDPEYLQHPIHCAWSLFNDNLINTNTKMLLKESTYIMATKPYNEAFNAGDLVALERISGDGKNLIVLSRNDQRLKVPPEYFYTVVDTTADKESPETVSPPDF